MNRLSYIFSLKSLINYHIRRNLTTQLNHQFVPKHDPVKKIDLIKLSKFIDNSKKILVLTGAGISTESGIPDYRSEAVGLYARTKNKPIQHNEFLKSKYIRQRYWARNFVGWYRFSKCQPNSTHFAIKDLEIIHKKVQCIVTQNVDNLHFKSGSKNVIELHGTAFRVICMNCQASYDRQYIQDKLLKNNQISFDDTVKMIRPDGDVDIPESFITNFIPLSCESCTDGILKPDITFFGDNVPRERVDLVRGQVSSSDSVLVLGSSLTVFSGYRILLQAVEENKNICIVNIGPTRADHLVKLKMTARCGDILPEVCKLISK